MFQGPGFGSDWMQNALGGGATNYPWLAQAGAEYANNKITYLSPQIYGFDVGLPVRAEPGQRLPDVLASGRRSPSISVAGQPTSLASPALGGDSLISTTTGNTSNRWYNQAGAGVRYEHTFGAVDVKAYGFYEHAAGEDAATYTTFAPGTAGYVGASANALHYDPINFYQFGAAVTTAGLTAAVTYQGGRVNNQLAPRRHRRRAHERDGVRPDLPQWPVDGRLRLRHHQLPGQCEPERRSRSVTSSKPRSVATTRSPPASNLVLEYDYYQTHQGDFNFATNAAGRRRAPTTT